MTTRKKQPPVKKQAHSRPAKRGAQARRTRGQQGKSVILAAECTVAGAESLKAQLMRRLGEPSPVTVDVQALQRIDTAGLQLLAAFVRDRRTAGRAVAWRGRAPALETAAGLLGLNTMLELPRETGR